MIDNRNTNSEHNIVLALKNAFPLTDINTDQLFDSSGSSYGDADLVMRTLANESWGSIPEEFVNQYKEALFFYSAGGFIKLLPGYLTLVVNNFSNNIDLCDSLMTTLTHYPKDKALSEFFKLWVEKLNQTQIDAINKALLFIDKQYTSRLRSDDPDSFQKHPPNNRARDAIESYWRQAAES